MFNFFKINKIRVLIAFIILVVIISSIISMLLYSQSQINKNVLEYFSNQIGNRGTKLGTDYLENKNKEIIITRFDINSPVVSLVYLRYDERQNQGIISSRAEVYKFNRQGFLDWSNATHLVSVDIDNKPFKEAVTLAQKYDLSTENPDPENITVFTPLKPFSSSETVVYPQGVTIPDQGGVENK